MRKLIAFLSIISLSAFAAPPTSIKGEAGSASFTQNIVLPNNQVTKQAGINSRIETGNKNLLVNPSFEHSTVTIGWTTTNTFTSPTSTLTKEASINIQDGTGSLKAVFGGTSTGAWSIYQDTTLYASGKSGQDAEASVWIYSAATDVWLCPRTNGVTPTASIANGCVQYTNIGAPQKLTVFMLYGSTSTGFVVTGSTSSTTVYLDDAYLGDRRPQMQGITTTPRTAYTPTFSAGFGSVTAISTSYWRVGNMLYVQGAFTTGTMAASLTSMSIPINLTIDSTKLPLNNSTSASGNVVGQASQNGTGTIFNVLTATATDATKVYFGGNNTVVGNIIPQNGTGVGWASTNITSISFSVPILEWVGDNNAFTTKCDDPKSCETVLTAYVNQTGSAATVSNENVDWIQGDCVRTSAGISTCTPVTGTFTVLPNCTGSRNAGTGSSGVAVMLDRANSTTSSLRFVMDAGGTDSDLPFHVVCVKAGADYTNSKISQQIIQMRGVPSVPGASGGIDTFSFTFGTTNATTACSANPCSYLDQIGNAVSSVGWASSGAYTLNTVKTYTKLKCTAAFGGTNGSNDIHLDQSKHLDCSNCNSLAFGSVSDSGAINTSGTLYCQGSY